MKPEQIYHALIELADKFKISVSEQNLQKTIGKSKSGFCIVKDQKRFIVDKHLPLYRKIDVLGAFLSTLPHEDMYIMPTLREVLYRYGVPGSEGDTNV